jgi:uroporphyrinogen decarboxylase
LRWAEQGPPSVATHPLESGKSLPDLPVFDPSMGRFPVALDALRTLKKDIGDEVALYGLICGPFTLALHLLGNSIFMQMFDHPDYVRAVVGFCASVGRKAAQAYLENGADIIGVVDPMTSQISAAHFQEFCTSPLNELFNFIREKKGYSSLFVCGDASRNLEAMGATTCDNMSIDENIPLEKVRDITRSCNKSFGGNLKLTAVLLLGDEDDAKLDAIRCIDIGGGCGFVLAPGCDLPFNVPEKNLIAVATMVHESYQREVAKRTIIARSASEADGVKLPDYAKDPRVMMDAVQRAAKRLAFSVAITEHRITTREGIAMMSRLKVSNLPTICLDGKAKFISLIPDQDTLVAAIEATHANKAKR